MYLGFFSQVGYDRVIDFRSLVGYNDYFAQLWLKRTKGPRDSKGADALLYTADRMEAKRIARELDEEYRTRGKSQDLEDRMCLAYAKIPNRFTWVSCLL